MKTNFMKFIVVLLSIVSVAHAELKPVDLQYLTFRNLLRNPGAEEGKAGWTATGLTFSTSTTAANVGLGRQSFSADASATAQYLTSSAVAIPAGLYGRNAEASCLIKTDATDYLLQAYDGSNIIASQTIVAGSTFTRQTLNFIMPSSGNISLRIASQSNAAIMYLDDCYLGEARNISQVSQATFVGAVKSVGKANCVWSRTSNASWDTYTADSDCNAATAEGLASAPSDLKPAIKLNNLPPGTYYFVANGMFYTDSSGTNCSYKFTDGTNSSEQQVVGVAGTATYTAQPSISGHITYTTAGNRVVEIQGTGQNGNNNCSIYNNQTTDTFSISVYRFPTTSETAMRIDQVAVSWSGQLGSASTCDMSTTSATIHEMDTGTNCVLYEKSNRNFGTVTQYNSGSLSAGITFTPPRVGKYFACTTFNFYGTTASSHGMFHLYDGTNVIAETDWEQNATLSKQATLCGVVTASSLSAINLRVRGLTNTGTLHMIGQFTGTNHTTMEWTIFGIDTALPAPYLVGGVSSSSAGQERVDRATFTCNSSAAINSSSSAMTIGNISSNACTLTFTTPFAAAPTCVVNANDNTAGIAAIRVHTATANSVKVMCYYNSTPTACSDWPGNIICMGSK